MMRYSVIPVGGGFWLGENKMYIYGKKIGGWFISFRLVFLSLSLSLGVWKEKTRKADEGEKEVTGGGFSVLGNSLAWIIYIAPIAPPALLKIHSS